MLFLLNYSQSTTKRTLKMTSKKNPTSKVQIPTLEGDLVANLISMNFGGKLRGDEIQALGQSFIDYVVNSKKINLIFGQQCVFRFTNIPNSCEIVGGQRALMIYNKKYLQVCHIL